MITPALEQKLLNGEAAYRTQVISNSGYNTILVPEDNYIIIESFTYFGFLDTDQFDEELQLRRRVHQVSFTSATSDNHFIVKDDLQRRTQMGMPTNDVQGHVKFDTWMVHGAQVAVDILHAPNEVPYGIPLTDVPPNSAQMFAPPRGYGNAAGGFAGPRVVDASLTQMIPTTVVNQPAVGGVTVYNNMRFGVEPLTVLDFSGLTSPDPRQAWSVPIINVGIIQVYEPLPNTIKPSISA